MKNHALDINCPACGEPFRSDFVNVWCGGFKCKAEAGKKGIKIEVSEKLTSFALETAINAEIRQWPDDQSDDIEGDIAHDQERGDRKFHEDR